MLLLVDSREQNKLDFSNIKCQWIDKVEVRALPFADYWCELKDGHTVPVVFERKAIGDFFNAFTNNYKNEKSKLKKAIARGFQYIVAIECSYTDVLNGFEYSSVDGLSLIRTMLTWYHKYGAITLYFTSREEMSHYIVEFFASYAKNYADNKKVSEHGMYISKND